jgi:hypothetical protein
MIILGMFILMIIGFAVWVYTMHSPSARLCNQLRKDKPVWNENCLYPQATGELDTSMKDPSDMQLFMADFSYSSAGGLPLCRPMWYRFRYVNDATGNYSEFSEWTCAAVMAGGTNLPCIGNCPPTGPCDERISGEASCSFNRVTMGVTTDLQYNTTTLEKDGSINWAVVYRYVGNMGDDPTKPPDDTPNIGEPLGYLAPTASYSGYTNAFVDIGNNPCSEVNSRIGCSQKCSICH